MASNRELKNSPDFLVRRLGLALDIVEKADQLARAIQKLPSFRGKCALLDRYLKVKRDAVFLAALLDDDIKCGWGTSEHPRECTGDIDTQLTPWTR